MKKVHVAVFAALLLCACGTRVSLGELPDDGDETTADGTIPTPAPAPSVAPGPVPAADAGALDAGPAPEEDSGDQDAGKAPYVPCAGKVCGEGCSICDPSDPNCFETAVPKQCDKNGMCVAMLAGC